MTVWYTADTHFGHENVIKYCKRPYHNVDEMDAGLIANINAAVTKEDDLWIVGDFACGAKARDPAYLDHIFSSLNGRKHLIVGNHDGELTQSLGWESVGLMAEVQDAELSITLCHYPMMTFNKARKGGLQLFGHVHDRWLGSANSVNVGVDVWDMKPVKLADIVSRAKQLAPHKHMKDVEPS